MIIFRPSTTVWYEVSAAIWSSTYFSFKVEVLSSRTYSNLIGLQYLGEEGFGFCHFNTFWPLLLIKRKATENANRMDASNAFSSLNLWLYWLWPVDPSKPYLITSSKFCTQFSGRDWITSLWTFKIMTAMGLQLWFQ